MVICYYITPAGSVLAQYAGSADSNIIKEFQENKHVPSYELIEVEATSEEYMTEDALEDLGKHLWKQYSDITISTTSERSVIIEDFLHFEKGTSVFDVKAWFDREFDAPADSDVENKTMVHVVAYQYNGGGGFNWYAKAEDAEKSYEREKEACDDLVSCGYEVCKFEFTVSDLESATDEIDGMLWETKFSELPNQHKPPTQAVVSLNNTDDYVIPAEVHTDDYCIEVPFDALLWFEQASEQAIVKLSECDWGGDYPADVVAQESSAWFKEIDKVFVHNNHNEDLSGFECSVDGDAALKWLESNKPGIYQIIENA